MYWEWIEPGGISRSVAVMRLLTCDGRVRGSIGLAYEPHRAYHVTMRTPRGRSIMVGYAESTTEAMRLLEDALAT